MNLDENWWVLVPSVPSVTDAYGRSLISWALRRNPVGKLDSRSPGFGVWSDWPDLNDLCCWAGVTLEWMGSDSEAVEVSEEVISDPNISVRATVNVCGTHLLPLRNARGHLLEAQQRRRRQQWTKLRLQGKTACLPAADHSVSHTVFKNQIAETMSHILNGCHVYRGLYICRHERIVDLISADILYMFRSTIMLYKYSTVKPSMFSLCNNVSLFSNVTVNTPDVVAVNENHREVFILEVGCTFDYSLEEAFLSPEISAAEADHLSARLQM